MVPRKIAARQGSALAKRPDESGRGTHECVRYKSHNRFAHTSQRRAIVEHRLAILPPNPKLLP